MESQNAIQQPTLPIVFGFIDLPEEYKVERDVAVTLVGVMSLISVMCSGILFKDYSTLGVHYRDLQARVHEQETRNLTLHEAQPSAVLDFEFLVRGRVLVNLIMHEQSVLKTF